MLIEIYIPTSEKYSRTREVETLEQAAEMVKNNIYVSDHDWRERYTSEIEYIKHAIFEVAKTKEGSGVILFCSENNGAYAKLVS